MVGRSQVGADLRVYADCVPLTIGIEEGRAACVDTVKAFMQAAAEFSEYDLLGASRCHGWTRLDVVTHVLGGWQEMLQGMVAPVEEAPTVDAASYWRAFDAEYAALDPVLVLMTQKRRGLAYSRPQAARDQLEDVAGALLRGIEVLRDLPVSWQGHVFAAADFLAVWAVEDAVHQLDLRSQVEVPGSGLGLARRTIEDLIEDPLPADWSDEQAVLIGTGRVSIPDEHRQLGERLPALG